jgi:mRNA-degrading endonuclease RelE of RelBE toxin-antitoxin system
MKKSREQELKKLEKRNRKWIKEYGNDEPTPYEEKITEIKAELKGIQEGKEELFEVIKKVCRCFNPITYKKEMCPNVKEIWEKLK